MANLNLDEDLDDIPDAAGLGESVQTDYSVVDKYLNEPLEDLPLADLIDLFEAIKAALPPHSLQDLNLTEEVVLQFMRTKELQLATLKSKSPANQKAQVANAVSNTLAQLTRLQTELHDAERFKKMENHMIRMMKTLPLEVAEEFLREYSK